VACPSENQLLDAMEGRLPASERAKLDAHVEECGVCRELLAASLHATTTLIEAEDKPKRARTRSSDSLLGATVGEYVVEQMIGSGGMGIVYRGSHPVLGKPVAIKILRPELAADAGHMRRMLGEARAMSSIAHRSIVDVFGFGELADGRQYMVMEFLQGEPLNRIIRTQAPMPAAALLPLLDGILEALAASHAAGVIHRDLKPSNLYLVRQADGTTYVKLLDFGLAKREVDNQGHTRAGKLVMGTPGYMAPEQIRAQEAGPAADLYALGVIAYELSTGQRPFRGKTPVDVMRQQVESTPVAPSQRAKGLPPGLERLILSLMAKSPKNRPTSAEEARKVVKAMMAAPVTVTAVRRSPMVIAAVGASVALAAVAVTALLLAPRARPAPAELPLPHPPQATRAVVEPQPEPEPPPQVEQAPKLVVERLTQKSLLDRAARLRKRLVKATPKGEEPDAMAAMLIKNTERDAKAARGDAELKQVEQTLADIERKYFRR